MQRSDETAPRQSFFERGGGWVLAQLAVMAGWLVLAPWGHSMVSSLWLLAPAVLLLATGVIVGIAGARLLGGSLTPFPMPCRDSQLVQTGIYALIRHPLYVSLIALSLSWACLWGSELAVVLAVVQAILLDAKARREESWLRSKFPDYVGYAARVKRFIPWLY